MVDVSQGQILLSRFELIRLLGRGGMGQVWLAEDQELQLAVALKFLHPELAGRPDLVDMLKSECRHTRQLVHPHIVRTFDFHRSNGLVFISMEYIDGESLDAYRRRVSTLHYADTLRRLLPITDALTFAHGQGLVHRDVKGGNILIDRSNISRLTDFGVSAIVHAGGRSLFQANGGSPYMLSPQQVDGHAAHPSDDVYALGVLLFELLTGSPPFYPDITAEKIRREIPPRVSEKLNRNTSIPPALEDLIAAMLAKTPQDRPAAMGCVRDAFHEILRSSGNLTLPPQLDLQTSAAGSTAARRLDIIPPLTPPLARYPSGRQAPARHNRMTAAVLVAALLALLSGGGLLLNYLSRNPVAPAPTTRTQPDNPAQATQVPALTPSPAPATVSDPAAIETQKKAVEEKLAEFQQLKADLDAKGADLWAAQLYAGTVRISQEADSLLVRKQFAAAAEQYAAAIEGLRQLAARAPGVFQQAVSNGRRALEQGDGETARQAFELALRIDPQNEVARRGLKRSETLGSVLELTDAGRSHEGRGEFALALNDYQKALEKDPEAEEARQGAARVKERLAEQAFRRHMSDGLAALNHKDFGAARSELTQARQIRPHGPEAAEALARLDAAERLSKLENLKARAKAAEQAEQWENALNDYQAALQIDNTLQFAIQGKQRCSQRSELDKRLQFYLQKPEVLESEEYLAKASDLLKASAVADPRGPRLQDQVQHLSRLVEIARTPVPVTLLSDDQTEVAVYRVGKLGRLTQRELSLRPGRYTVVGTRDGYRDVRREIDVRAQNSPIRIRVECSEKIK
jgi:serine/threonine protein kinase